MRENRIVRAFGATIPPPWRRVGGGLSGFLSGTRFCGENECRCDRVGGSPRTCDVRDCCMPQVSSARSIPEHVARTKRAAFRDWDYWGRPGPGFGDPDARGLVVSLAPAAAAGHRT